MSTGIDKRAKEQEVSRQCSEDGKSESVPDDVDSGGSREFPLLDLRVVELKRAYDAKVSARRFGLTPSVAGEKARRARFCRGTMRTWRH